MNSRFSQEDLPFINWWLAEFPAKKPAIHKSMNGRFSWEKTHHSPIYELQLINKSPEDTEDINKLTYQKTGLDWSRLVFDRSWNSQNDKGLQTGLRLQSFTVLWFLVLAGPSPVQSWSFSSPGTRLPNTTIPFQLFESYRCLNFWFFAPLVYRITSGKFQ